MTTVSKCFLSFHQVYFILVNMNQVNVFVINFYISQKETLPIFISCFLLRI